MLLPAPVLSILSRLRAAGFSAYAVGGCVRDSLLGKAPGDWDICTSALPEEMQQVFAGEHVVETGLRHGTLTVVLDHVPYEITTYRLDGAYTDHRHPDSVSFVTDLSEDLARRDFTINAMACDESGEIVDLYGGREDLSARLIRCVGDPSARFEEDALRVLRALRFASVLDFEIEPVTALAVRAQYRTLENVAAERKRVELVKLLCGPGAGRILREYTDVFAFLIPPLAPCIGYNQDNPHHLYTVYEHIVRAVENVPPDPVLRMTMLLHDVGKPAARTTDEKGIGHYFGHQDLSARMAAKVLEDYRFDRASAERICRLVAAHDIPLDPDRKIMLRRLKKFGEEDLRALFVIHRADRIATGTRNPDHATDRMHELSDALDALLAEHPCYSLKTLAVNGRDLTALGYTGPEVGKTLDRLLNKVIDGALPNDRDALLNSLPRKEKS